MSTHYAAQPSLLGRPSLKLQNFDIVCVSIMDWDWPFPTSRQNLMHEFAKTNRVLFVDPPINYWSEYQAMKDNLKTRNKFMRGLTGRIIQREKNLFSFTPFPALPFNRLPAPLLIPLLKMNGLLFTQSVRWAARRLGMKRPLLWISLNPYFGVALKGKLNEQLVLYHCTDDLGHFPGYSPEIVKVEHKLMKRSDMVITTSKVLEKNKRAYNPNTFFVPNGADIDLFKQALNSALPLPQDLVNIPEPRVGFTGQIEFRFDIDLLIEVARRKPDVSFVLVGPKKHETEGLERLEAEPNIYFLGGKPQSELPAYLRGLKVGLIPYKTNELTRSIYPLKLHEYLAAGRPIVSTPLPSLEQFKDLVRLAATPEEFVAALDQALSEGEDTELILQRQAVAECHSWQHIADVISDLMLKGLEESSGSLIPS